MKKFLLSICFICFWVSVFADSGQVNNVGQPGAPGGGIVFEEGINVGDNFISRRAGISTLGKGTGISEALIIPLHALSSFTNNVGTVEIGSIVDDVLLSWTYNRNANDPFSQQIDQGVGVLANNLRQIQLNNLGIIVNTTWTIDAVGDDESYGAPAGNPSQRITSVLFLPGVYHGVSQANDIDTGVEVMANFGPSIELDANRQHVYNFDASVGGGNNYLYIAYPQAYGNPVNTQIGGFDFNGYETFVDNLINDRGFAQNYIILKTLDVQNDNNIDWEIF
ncbi:MAG: hypothetical protein COX62_01420 [Deltaproteobacteria bacterium CG_4_10_14_0_2_um_filter_43_8]|nr:MAG: hypothetical protein COV43_04420 [Deltaproteobacteria bacterium CG11_big_fil_rev_8_21_14_0_20_42_23]PJA21812.1 MAG: hypothetical protein COX62_01420 [Deltaproteobacteria bacterium CG_4_10_14_0_2_um_filter_43_8]PJC65019.1 MAG: hypothetical protein CO021_00810 [Deltaproteobacteria bacterium CG_4_9_14_0_2_um_filter_42_21]